MRWDYLKYVIRHLPEYLFPKERPLTCQTGQTLDADDVALARKWLKRRRSWFDNELETSFATEFARWNGSRYAFAFMGGRVALSACLQALELQPGDEVLMPGYSCVVVSNALHFAGLHPLYCDIELDTYGLDVAEVERRVTPKTRAILLHHLYGLVCRDYEAIIDFARRHNLKVIEDCAHATGAEYKGIKVGNRGDIAFYSSNRAKVFSTVEGGVAVANDPAVGDRLAAFHAATKYPDEALIEKLLQNVLLDYYSFKHPKRLVLEEWTFQAYNRYYHYSTSIEEQNQVCPAGYFARMPAPLAALGRNQLRKIDRYNELRRETAKHWAAWCDAHNYRKPIVVANSMPVFLRYPVLVEPEKKANTAWATKELGVELGVWFVSNLHPSHIIVQGCPKADRAVRQCVNFPGI